MENKYQTGLFASRPQVWKAIRGKSRNCIYLVPVDILNVADHVHVDPLDEKSQGYGGSVLSFQLEDGTMHYAKGPWHGGTMSLLKDVGLDVRDLHATAVTLYEVVMEPYTGKRYEDNPETGRKEYVTATWDIPARGKVLYEEKEPVLGMFMRGDRIGHAYANATGKPVFVDVESAGGGSKKMISPGQEMHPMAANYE